MKKNISIALVFATFVLCVSCASRQKAAIPTVVPEAEIQKMEAQARELNQKPMNKAQARRGMREREKASEQTYEKHHDRIQTKEVRKRMKKDKKKSAMQNSNKKPGKLKKLFM
ncbi:MAG: hypothetical protein LBU90_07030 [Bacteroidales bacterium]|jgi:hypothetical protein|nr:hypothetical protein [Bacteroidales bacterium]